MGLFPSISSKLNKILPQNLGESANNLNSENNKNAKVLSFLNQKGGVGKTSITLNTAYALNKLGKKVLLIDMDPQYNLSTVLEDKEYEFNIYHLLINSIKELKTMHSPVLLSDLIINKNELLDYIPSGQMLGGFELTVSNINYPRQLILKKFLEKNNLLKIYDYILIDGPPTLGLLVVNILCATNGVLIPFIPDAFCKQGIKNLLQTIDDIEDMEIVMPPRVVGLIPNLFDKRRKFASQELETLKENFSHVHIFEEIENKVDLFKSMGARKSIFDYNSIQFSNIQEKFLNIAKKIIKDHSNEIQESTIRS